MVNDWLLSKPRCHLARYQDSEIGSQQVRHENGRHDDGVADERPHGQEVVALRADLEDVAISAHAAQEQADDDQDLHAEGGKEKTASSARVQLWKRSSGITASKTLRRPVGVRRMTVLKVRAMASLKRIRTALESSACKKQGRVLPMKAASWQRTRARRSCA